MNNPNLEANGFLFPTYFQDNFFFEKYNIKTQIDLNNIIDELNLHNPELKVTIYDYLIVQNLKDDHLKDDHLKDEQNPILITDEIIKTTIVDYFKYLMLHAINKQLALKEYNKYKDYDTKIHKNPNDKNKIDVVDYLNAFNETKKEIQYYDNYLKVLKSTDWVYKIIQAVNDNKTLLSKEIKCFFKNLKKNEN